MCKQLELFWENISTLLKSDNHSFHRLIGRSLIRFDALADDSETLLFRDIFVKFRINHAFFYHVLLVLDVSFSARF